MSESSEMPNVETDRYLGLGFCMTVDLDGVRYDTEEGWRRVDRILDDLRTMRAGLEKIQLYSHPNGHSRYCAEYLLSQLDDVRQWVDRNILNKQQD